MLKKEEIWQSIKMYQQQSRKELDQTRESEDQSSFISDNDKENLFKNKSQQCSCKMQMLQLKKECMLQIRELKAQHQKQLNEIEQLFTTQMEEQTKKYEQEIQSLKDDLEFYMADGNEQQIFQLIEEEQRKDKEMFQKQLDIYLTDKIKLEQQLMQYMQLFSQCQKEIKQLKEQNQQHLQQSVHKNCAPQLFRDTNRKVKMTLEGPDRSTVYDDSENKGGFCNSIKNFNVNIKLMEKSQQSQY